MDKELVLVLNRNIISFDGDVVCLRSCLRIDDHAARLDLELPEMPRTTHDFPFHLEAELAGIRGSDEGGRNPEAERRALMRTYVADRIIMTVDIINADAAAFDFDDFAGAGRDLRCAADQVTVVAQAPTPPAVAGSDGKPYSSAAFS